MGKDSYKMKTFKFFVINKWAKVVTGGQKYDKMLFDILKGMPDSSVDEIEIKSEKSFPVLKVNDELRQGYKERKSDYIFFNSARCLRYFPILLMLKTFSKAKIYTIHHHFIYHSFRGIKKLAFFLAERYFLKLSDKIVVPSPYINEELKKFKKEKDLLHWRIPFETKPIYSTNPQPGNLTYIGTIEPRKGLSYLMEALNLLSQEGVAYHLDILGQVVDEAYNKQLLEYIKDNNLNVSFRGFVELEEKNKILSTTDIFVFPSVLEGFGMVLVEAQEFGIPIVCFDNTAMPFTVKDGINGFTVATGNHNAMAGKIKDIITDRSLRDRLGANAYENLKEQWTHKKYQDTVENYFKKS